MHVSRICLITLVLTAHCTLGTAAAAPAWVTDRFEITLRSGPSTSNAIELMLRSGTEVEVLEQDRDTGYSRVRTRGGTEGWVLSRYLMDEPAARDQLATLTQQLTDANAEEASLTGQLEAIRTEYREANARIETLEAEKAGLQEQLAEIRRTAANTLAINQQNESLRQQLANSESRIQALERQNRELSDETTRYWFLSGAAVLLFGMILGIWIPRIRWRRGSRYDRF